MQISSWLMTHTQTFNVAADNNYQNPIARLERETHNSYCT
jgi:hypothetical protein